MTTKSKKVEMCFCQSYYDDDNVLQNCTCGKCKKQTKEKKIINAYAEYIRKFWNSKEHQIALKTRILGRLNKP